MERMKIKRCPFCGGEADCRINSYDNDNVSDVVNIRCRQCGATSLPYLVYYGLDSVEKFNKATERWNRRVDISVTTDEETGLKSCPFCGGRAYFCGKKISKDSLWVECLRCGASSPYHVTYIPGDTKSEKEAERDLIKCWNKRVTANET